MTLKEVAACFGAVFRPREVRRGEGFLSLIEAIDSSRREAEETTALIRDFRHDDPTRQATALVVDRLDK